MPRPTPATNCRLPLPCAGESRPLRLERAFHKPTGLAVDSRLALCFASLPPGTSIELNHRTIAGQAAAGETRCWLSAAELLEFNAVCLRIPPQATGSDTPIGPAWLEIADSGR